MRIGELARRTGCRPDTVRYYEKEGLLPPPERSDGNYRLYNAAHLARLSFIRNCRALEMNLDEIRALLALTDGACPDCGEVNTLLETHIGHITERIDRLQALQAQLRALRQRCTGATPIDQCGIIRELTEPAVPSK
ncbi:transcriptional regulator, MerR family [Solidesulfovibrio fructosivorans JJ]]|uniref:Transcriptional regulator, MerR family n=1 Tax=Solidesulfovibrio fructosivorans JJ] TaxID=596151 RepID=E1JTJ7_SOLFR|nr:Cd(II)/Pb(II)-responsive transcriptional regulator [Solidesulfovibrio fructosivorans]EFL52457.1 transcriptional regulator, MerR family [Solidesulfovibrio fructosivorans JJ]]